VAVLIAPDAALTRNPSRLVALGDVSTVAPKIQIYSGAGQLLETLPVRFVRVLGSRSGTPGAWSDLAFRGATSSWP